MAATPDPSSPDYVITRDPALVKNRIFVGNLPICTSDQLKSICLPYGKVLGVLVVKNFGFVQFESEEMANKVASALNQSTFKSNVLTVRNASVKIKGPPKGKQHPAYKAGGGRPIQPPMIDLVGGGGIGGGVSNSSVVDPGAINDCEIIVVNRENTKYAEYIEDRLRQAAIRVDVLFPNEDAALGQVLASISARGCLYAVLVTSQHQALNSITVNILYGIPAEHRNMPLEDAITLIITDFRNKKIRDNMMNNCLPSTSTIARHPETMQQLINLLANNRSLTAYQLEIIIKYLRELHEKQVAIEVGCDLLAAKPQPPDPEIELQKKLQSIMNKPSVINSMSGLMYPTFEMAKDDRRLIELLQDTRILTSMERIYNSRLLDTVAAYL